MTAPTSPDGGSGLDPGDTVDTVDTVDAVEAAAGRVDDPLRPRRRRETKQPGLKRSSRWALQGFLIVMAVGWMVPLVGAFYNSFRNYRSDTLRNGVFSAPNSLTLDNYRNAWTGGNIAGHFGNTMFIVIPALFITLLFASLVAFACTRFSWRFNIFFLVLFTAGNLLPHQVAFQPLFQIFRRIPWPDVLSDVNTGNLLGTKVGVIIIHIAFQTGFCAFVLSNYMKTIPKEITEAALVDGAGMSRQFFQVIMPLCRPALAALATLLFTWLYNDFFWGSVMIQQASERPITSAIQVLNGQWTVDYNLIAAASMMIALPTLAVFIALQKQFIGGLTLGSNKG